MDPEEKEYIPPTKYVWRVVLEIPDMVKSIEANTAEEAMEIAEGTYQLKDFDLDKLPELICTEATISDVTKEYRDEMKAIKDANQEDPFTGFLQEQPTWGKK
jgi:ethanolamine ammonia-lyase small subunit